MKNILLCVCSLLMLGGVSGWSQNITISGRVNELGSGETLIGANVYNGDTYQGTTTNVYGFYSLTLPAGQVKLTASFVGYQPYEEVLNLQKDTLINIRLQGMVELEAVEVVGRHSESGVESSQMSMMTIPVNSIKTLPVLLGEVDVIKAIQLLPGVQSGSEGSSGLYVRGGGPDQNLVLLDGVPVYNVNHLFGFFSVFNADAVNSVSLVKGGFPARYGGRLSSVLDIRMKEGNMNEVHGEGAVGFVASRFTIEGPIIKDRTSFLLSGRRTYLDILAQPFIRMQARAGDYDKLNMGYYFYDLNAKVNHIINQKNRLFISAYMGNDKAYYREKDSWQDEYYDSRFKLRWGNITTALRWNHVINNKLFSNTTLTYSRYKFLTGIREEDRYEDETDIFDFSYSSGIEDLAAKVDFDFIPSTTHYIRFGVSETAHNFNPGVNAFKQTLGSGAADNIDTTFGNRSIRAHELAAYIEDDIEFTALLKGNVGLHYSGFYVGDTYYQSLQPRLSMRYLMSEKWSLKGAFSTMTQYVHLLANSSVGLPTDLWLPVTDSIKPQQSMQLAIGSVYRLNQQIEISLEGFYKTMDNLIEYSEGASFLSQNDDWQEKIEQGKGWSYGMEFLVRKSSGKTTGWLGYTLSWSERQFENISFGERFPYKYDRRHDVSLVVNHQFSDRFDMGLNWVYGTGNAFTLAQESYRPLYTSGWGGEPVIDHIEMRNNFRMPSYHRLDVGMNFHKQKRWGERTWSVSVYNAYNHQNPFFLYFTTDYDNGEPSRKLKQVSLFPIIPSISYSFKF